MKDFDWDVERWFCNNLIYVHLSLGKCERKVWPDGEISSGTIHFFFQFFFPIFTDNEKHVDWVKAAWRLGAEIKPEKPQLEAAEEEEYDPIPF